MLTLPTTLLQQSEAPHGGQWIWAWDIELERRTKTLPPVVFRMTSHHEPIQWDGAASGVSGLVTYYPFAFTQTEIEQDNEGNLPGLDLTIDNTGRVLMQHIHAGGGFEGNRASLLFTHAFALAAGTDAITYDFQVASATASGDGLTLRLEPTNLNEKRLPWGRYIQGTCRFQFGGIECGYSITPTAGFTDCPKTVAACTARGDDEVLRQLPRLHPRRFGGFPGIATQRGA